MIESFFGKANQPVIEGGSPHSRRVEMQTEIGREMYRTRRVGRT